MSHPPAPLPLHRLHRLAGNRQAFTRVSCVMGSLMVMAFGVLDWLVEAPGLWALLMIRLGITACLLAVFWCSFQAWFDRHYLVLMSLIYMITSVGILAMPMVAAGNRIVAEHYYVGALLCLSAMMTLTLVSVRAVLGLTVFIVLVHLVFALMVFDLQSQFAVLMCQLFFLITSAYIGFIGVRFRNAMLIEKLDLAHQLETQMDLVKRTSQEKSRFMAAASHDLRQPLQAIALFGAVLEKQLQGRDEHPTAQRLMQAVGALGISLESMLDSSRLDAGVVSTDMRPVELNAVLLELNHVFSAPAEEKGLQLRLRASGLWVQSDAQLLRRLLSNLVDNAIKYTPAGGVIVCARDRGDEVWLDVVDTGIGIASEHTGLVFEEFYQVNNPGRDRSQGLGIGLSVVKRLLRLLGHDLQVASSPGRGTRFRLVLRAAPSPGQVEHRSSGVVAVRDEGALPSRVLVLDDEGDIRVAVAALLAVHGISVMCVSNAGQAEQAIENATCTGEPFDVFVCDYRLSQGDDGLRLARHVIERPELAMRVLLLTGETAAERLRSVQASGIQVLFKPVLATELLSALRGAALPNPASA